MFKNLRRKAAVMGCVLLFTVAGISIPLRPALGMQGPFLLKLGWTYAMAFPEITQVSGDFASGLARGINTYRVMQYGGDQWYLVQIILRRPGGGWYVPQGAPTIWVNMNNALWVQEIVR